MFGSQEKINMPSRRSMKETRKLAQIAMQEKDDKNRSEIYKLSNTIRTSMKPAEVLSKEYTPDSWQGEFFHIQSVRVIDNDDFKGVVICDYENDPSSINPEYYGGTKEQLYVLGQFGGDALNHIIDINLSVGGGPYDRSNRDNQFTNLNVEALSFVADFLITEKSQEAQQ